MRDHVLGRQKTDPSVRALNISSVPGASPASWYATFSILSEIERLRG